MNRLSLKILALAMALPIASPAPAQSTDDNWQFRLTPYLWLPTIGGDVRYEPPPDSGTGAPGVSVGPADWLELLNYGMLIGGSAQKGKLRLFADLVYLSMTSKKNDRIVSVEDTVTIPGTPVRIPVGADLNADTQTDLDGMLLSFVAGYAFRETSNSTAIVFAGARYFDVDLSTSWDLTVDITRPGGGVTLPASGSISGSATLWDAVIGLRGEFAAGKGDWSVPWHFDYGTGDSERTWNAFIGLARAFAWGDLLLAYRHLEYDQGDDALLQDFSFSGPLFGVRFSF